MPQLCRKARPAQNLLRGAGGGANVGGTASAVASLASAPAAAARARLAWHRRPAAHWPRPSWPAPAGPSGRRAGRVAAGYALAAALAAAAFALSWALNPWLRATPSAFGIAAVALAAWAGGPGPALLTIALTALGTDYLFLGPPFALAPEPDSLASAGFYAGTAGLVAGLVAWLRRALAWERAARAEAEAAVRSREEFLSVAAHELRTPVTTLRGYAQVLLRQFEKAEGPDPAKVGRALQTFEHQSDKLTRLVTQLLDLSRIRAGQLVLEPEATDLAALVEGVAATAQATVGQPVQVRGGQPRGARVRASVDPLRLEQVLINLIDNATKYGQGPIEVEVVQPSPAAVQLAVRDRGPGVPPEHRQQIFERFFQARSTAKGEGQVGGLGLGLHISRQIVELHGGRIEAEFPPEGGTRFVVTLPAGLDEAAGAGPAG